MSPLSEWMWEEEILIHCLLEHKLLHNKASQKTKTRLPGSRAAYSEAYPKDSKSYRRNTCTSMFILVLPTSAKKGSQPRYPPTDECLKKKAMCGDNGIFFSQKEK